MAIKAASDTALRRALTERLAGSQPAASADEAHLPGVALEHLAQLRELLPTKLTAASVLMPIVDRAGTLSLLLTQRAARLRHHAGQISFPGGRLEAHDTGPLAAALRETEEEIGLHRDFISVAGYLKPQLIVTGFWVVPVVGFVRPDFSLTLDPLEVEEAFEVPLAAVLDPANHGYRERRLGPIIIRATEIHCEGRVIWGATAAMLVALSNLLKGT